MGKLVYFCAGTDLRVLPAKTIDALLLNVVHNGATERDIEASRNLIAVSQAKSIMLDSGASSCCRPRKRDWK